MLPEPQDTIVALSSAAGPGARAVIRLTGPAAFSVAGRTVTTERRLTRLPKRSLMAGRVNLPGLAPLPADLICWPAPHSYTGQDLFEIHTVSSPPLVDLLIGELLRHGARAAEAGEFTLRAFLAGKLDLPRAEAVLAVIEAGNREELQDALGQLAGGLASPLRQLRSDLLDLLADVEAALDFTEDDLSFITSKALLDRLTKAMAIVTNLRRQVDGRAVSQRPFRVSLTGRPNAGKSSLFNALAGKSAALVSAEPGTTRDYLCQRVEIQGIAMELIDTAGLAAPTDELDAQAQALGGDQARQSELILFCRDASAKRSAADVQSSVGPAVVPVWTKCDLAAPPDEGLATSAVTRQGLDQLRALIAERARRHRRPALAPSLSRCRHHLESALGHLRQAHQIALFEEPPELLALELRGTLDQLGEMVGAVYTDDLLDRIFSRFCIGK
ncbi:MAG TPA: tRNA modification GTPase [Gemmataceae bacterium]|nr:tRNA modification GTPase [Gemmataceae bacterium]